MTSWLLVQLLFTGWRGRPSLASWKRGRTPACRLLDLYFAVMLWIAVGGVVLGLLMTRGL